MIFFLLQIIIFFLQSFYLQKAIWSISIPMINKWSCLWLIDVASTHEYIMKISKKNVFIHFTEIRHLYIYNNPSIVSNDQWSSLIGSRWHRNFFFDKIKKKSSFEFLMNIWWESWFFPNVFYKFCLRGTSLIFM